MHSAVAHKEVRESTARASASGILTIDLQALRRNYCKIRERSAPARVAGVVKADAYGLGAVEVVQALLTEGCRDFFVAELIEATRVAPTLPPDARVFVLNGLQPGNEDACAHIGAIPVANSLDQLQRWRETAAHLRRRLQVVVQLDTGMSRLGIDAREWHMVRDLVDRRCDEVDLLFVMSHLASAEDVLSPQNDRQLASMQQAAKAFPGREFCLANSGGIFLGQSYHFSMVRPGIALYGGSPMHGTISPMEPVVRLDVPVIQTRLVPTGTQIGYGGAHVTHREMRLATLAVGYADGLPRCLGGRGVVFCGDARLPIVGRISMDSTIVDATALPRGALSLGSMVEVLGTHQTIDDVARCASTISYEILTRCGNRYQRVYV